MRRLLSIFLLSAFALPVVAPLLALGQDTEANLPACCRRNGTHHCMMNVAAAQHDSSTPTVRGFCPGWPQPQSTPAHFHPASLGASPHLLAAPPASVTAQVRAETQRRISRERTRQTRGPPAAILAA